MALFGTTSYGGDKNCNCGVVLELTPQNGTPNYTETVLHTFHGNDGASPVGRLTISGGTLFGATSSGGEYGAGTVFALTPNGSHSTYSILYSFQGGFTGEIRPVRSL